MAITEKDIDEFKKLYKEHYGEELNDFVAYEAANRLIQMIKAVYKPIPKAEEELYNKLEKEHEAVPESERIDFVKHLVEDAKVTEFKGKIGEKKFWDLVIKARTMDKNMPIRKLLLSSNGRFVIEKGFRLLFDDISKIKLAYVTTAGKGSRDKTYLEIHKGIMEKEGINFEELDIEGRSEDELKTILKDKNAIWVEGGNTFYLLKAVRESGFDKVIKEFIKKGIPYIGSSAGAYIACPTIEMAAWKPKQKDRFSVTDFTALSLVPFLVTAHYTPELENALKEKISKAKYPTRILQDGQGILVEGENYKLVGEREEIKL